VGRVVRGARHPAPASLANVSVRKPGRVGAAYAPRARERDMDEDEPASPRGQRQGGRRCGDSPREARSKCIPSDKLDLARVHLAFAAGELFTPRSLEISGLFARWIERLQQLRDHLGALRAGELVRLLHDVCYFRRHFQHLAVFSRQANRRSCRSALAHEHHDPGLRQRRRDYRTSLQRAYR
jgi:hypothetical protein